MKESVIEIFSKISGTSKNDLIHYIALRRKILDIFCKSTEVDESGAYLSEGMVHDIIFPRRGDTEITSFKDHNLWIVDERLNFTTYVSSDIPLNGKNTERPDLIVYNKRVLFRGDNEASNPITIFEFKKPQRDDFVNPSSQEDPVQQIVRYVNNIRDGRYKTPEGRKMLVADNTPFYGYVVCDLTPKVESWLEREKDFKPMPDRLGWFQWMGNINLYVEVISWDKVLKDAKMRNQIFFQKLASRTSLSFRGSVFQRILKLARASQRSHDRLLGRRCERRGITSGRSGRSDSRPAAESRRYATR